MTHWTPDHWAVGLLPMIFLEEDPRSAQEQANDRYAHGGGWNSFDGFEFVDGELRYPEDPPMMEIASAPFRDQTLRLYQHGWVAITKGDELIDVARID